MNGCGLVSFSAKGWARSAAWLVLGVGLLLPVASRAQGADTEFRDFKILVDGKPAGEYHMTVQRRDDGSVSLAAQSDVKVTVLLVTAYSYSYRGLEVWKDGRLLHLESSGKENSKPFTVRADAEANGLRVVANGQEHVTRADVWTTSCWQLPDARFRNQLVPLLGCDNGQDMNGQLQFIAAEPVKVAGQDVACSHYRVMKDVPHEVWYDGAERLVHEEWTSASGHHTVLEITGLHR